MLWLLVLKGSSGITNLAETFKTIASHLIAFPWPCRSSVSILCTVSLVTVGTCVDTRQSPTYKTQTLQTWESLPLKYITLKVLLCVMKETCNPCQSTQKLCYALQVIKGRLLNFSTWDLFTLCIWVYIINGSKIFAVWPILKENAVIGTFSSRQ